MILCRFNYFIKDLLTEHISNATVGRAILVHDFNSEALRSNVCSICVMTSIEVINMICRMLSCHDLSKSHGN